jgi:hypothetical protein
MAQMPKMASAPRWSWTVPPRSNASDRVLPPIDLICAICGYVGAKPREQTGAEPKKSKAAQAGPCWPSLRLPRARGRPTLMGRWGPCVPPSGPFLRPSGPLRGRCPCGLPFGGPARRKRRLATPPGPVHRWGPVPLQDHLAGGVGADAKAPSSLLDQIQSGSRRRPFSQRPHPWRRGLPLQGSLLGPRRSGMSRVAASRPTAGVGVGCGW